MGVSAAIVDYGSYLTDTKTGLDWLDVTTSVNQSYDYVNGQFGLGGEYEGWRFASGSQFNELVNHYTGSSISAGNYGKIVHAENKIDSLVDLFGSTLDAFYYNEVGKSHDEYYSLAEGEGLDYTAGWVSDVGNLTSGPSFWIAVVYDNDIANAPDLTRAHNDYFPSGYSNYSLGSYLVRDALVTTPIPAAVFMFAPALLGLMGLRRKRRT